MRYRELRHQLEKTRCFLGSPSLTRAPDGALVAVHDYFGPGSPKIHGAEGLSTVYRSEDDGDTWREINHIACAYWSTLFTHRGALYLLGTDREYGGIAIRRSLDGGWNWTTPDTPENGLLFRDGPGADAPNYHGAPVPVLEHEGRLYRAFENNTTRQWPTGFAALVISAPADADLLDAAQWTKSNEVPLRAADFPAGWGVGMGLGWLEGNVLADPEGGLWNMLRLHSPPEADRAAMLRIRENGRRLEFDPEDVIRVPGGGHKFVIRRDPKTGLYLNMGNACTLGKFSQRNVLTLCHSKDLRNWSAPVELVTDESGLSREDSIRLTGFQYPDWHFDGDDLIALVRTAWRGSVQFHDANRITFHRFRDFRRYLP